MSRPGFVLEVEKRTPPLLVGDGGAGHLATLPLGTQVVYANEYDSALQDVEQAIGSALGAPKGTTPLADLLEPSSSLTVVVTGLAVAPMAQDIRGRLVERILDVAAERRVDDVQVLLAIGTGRRLGAAELAAVLGRRVVDALGPDHLVVQHDLADPAGPADLGSTDRGEPVLVNRRLAASDVVVTVNVARTAADAGAGFLAEGVVARETLDAMHGFSAAPDAQQRVAAVLADRLPLFAIDVVTDQQDVAAPFGYLGRREWEWSVPQRLALTAARRAGKVAPERLHKAMWEGMQAREICALTAGAPDQVAEATRTALADQQMVQVPGQADVLITTVPGRTPHNAGLPADPLTAAWAALAGLAGAGSPVRAGGAVIICHPLRPDFSPTEHSAAGDFFTQVLTRTTDPQVVHDEHEQRFATDDWYGHLHRDEHGYAGMLPVYQWYAISRAREHCGDIVWVGADRDSAARLGMRAATSLADALEIVSNGVGPDPQLTYLHPGPTMVTDVVGSRVAETRGTTGRG
ncbi:protein of unknown function [Raineyella antarctica]|uniref:LarA-like N-terminal domain-containing protein n=1 Tax=Raineyella antarctica TaxID=1577474 RepID=A0A1G6GT84_9ACTN|nr:lactate racemase domain-containing protein [Raineyella antarctica]SDB85154.1 protein of unknown function [Raineyella antarctica]